MDLSERDSSLTGPTGDAAVRPSVAAARRIVVKLGTRVLTHDAGGLALARMFGIVETVARERGDREFLIVSSGAVELGREFLGLASTPADIELRQACAAVGQARLMALYQDGFSQFGLNCGQVLLTQGDFEDHEHYVNLCRTLNTLLGRHVVPIINENDAVSTEELELELSDNSRAAFGDNDRLSALVAAKLPADLLVLLTDVKGLYHMDPRTHGEARLLSRVENGDGVDAGPPGSSAGRGGMRSKVDAATVAARGGCDVVIASGRESGNLERVLRGEDVGTWFPGHGNGR